MKYLLTFVAIACLVSGCVITDYPVVTDHSFARLWWGALVEVDDMYISSYYQQGVLTGTNDDEGLLHWSEWKMFLDQDFEGNQTLNNWASWIPSYEPLRWRYDFPCRTYTKAESKAMNEYAYTRADGVFVEYEAPRFCIATYSDNPVIRPSSTITPGVFDYVRNLECPAQQFTVLVSYFGHTYECDGIKEGPKAESLSQDIQKLNAFEKVEILNELATHGILVDGVYEYTIKGSDLRVEGIAGDKSFTLDLTGKAIPVSVKEDLGKMKLDLSRAVCFADALNQVADISEEVGAKTPISLNVSWKGISKQMNIALVDAERIRDLASQYSGPIALQ
jgi:hypothetical protein